MIRILLLSALLVSASCTPPATVGAEGGIALLNQAEAVRAMDMFYDPLLRDAGVTGTVVVDLALEADGTVRESRVVRSTHELFTDSARRAARIMRFTPQAEPGAAVRVRMQFIYRGGEIEVLAS